MRRCVAGFLLLLVLQPAVAAGAPEPGLFLVSFDGLPPAAGALLGSARVLESFPFANVALVEARAASALGKLPGVVGVYADEPVTLAMERERGIVDANPVPGADWPTGEGVTVALVDSGIDPAHPAFAGRIAESVRISRGGVVTGDAGDTDGHGTHVAGIVAGDGAGSANGRHRGIAPASDLVAVDISSSFTTTNAVRAFAWIHENAARHNIRVVSNSWGREKDDAHYDVNDPVIRASDALVADGIVVVFSAGNRGRDGSSTLTTEAMNPHVITVAAASATGRVESYSSRGPPVDGSGRALGWLKPDVSAPGTAVISTRASSLAPESAASEEDRYYTTMNGTSMAAPQVAAAAALLLSRHPDLTPADVLALLQASASDVGATGADSETGYGMLDVAAALDAARFANGGERRVVVETRLPVRHAGSVAAALGHVVLADNTPRLPPASAVSIPLVLPPGSSATELWFNWTGDASFEARLVGPSGSLPFERWGGRSLHLEAGAAPGAWRVEASPQGPANLASFTLAGAIVVREERVVEVAAESHGRQSAPRGGFAPAQSSGIAALDTLASAPLLVLALSGVAATAVALRLRRR